MFPYSKMRVIMMQYNNVMQEMLLNSLAQAENGGFKHIEEILTLTESFSKWVGMNPAMKQTVQAEISEQEHLEYKAHMGAMIVALRDSKDSPKEKELRAAASLERLKALNVVTGATLRAFSPRNLAIYTPAELEESQYLSEIKKLRLDNMAVLAEFKP
jgi:hypothetical protein